MAALVLLVSCFYSYSVAEPVKEEVTISDDGWVEVPLDFTFPFYGQNFTTSFMFSNGVVMFVHPNTNSAYGLCCDGPDVEGILNGTSNSNYNYILNRNMNALNFTISPFLTDLIQRNGQGKFYIQGDETFQRYFWEDVMEYYNRDTANTFDLTITPDGDYKFNYSELDIRNHQMFVGTVGDLDENQYKQYFLHNARANGGYYWTTEEGSQPTWVPPDTSICEAQPLSDPSCEGYAEALANQEYNLQCSLDALYDPGCPGYDVANATEDNDFDFGTEFDFSEPELTGDAIIDDIISVELPDFDFSMPDFDIAPIEIEVIEIQEEAPEEEAEIAMLELPESTQDEIDEGDIGEAPEEIEEETTEEVVEEPTEEEQAPEEVVVEETETEEAEVEQQEQKEEKKQDKKNSKKSKVKSIIAKKSAEMTERLAMAVSLEQQIEAQNLAMALINFNQGFGAYRYKMPGGNLGVSEIPYSQKQMPENSTGLRNGLAQQLLHEKMVDAQYK